MDELHDLIFEVYANVGTRCQCGEPATTRCTECFLAHSLCTSCLVQAHQQLPFHWAQVWNGHYWEKKDLVDLGLVVPLGHKGIVCPESNPFSKYSDITVTHTNGVHRVCVVLCECNHRGINYAQLMRARLFPASLEAPASAFTFDTLETFELLLVQGKLPAYEYFETLKRMTDNISPHRVPNRYKEFLRVHRVWRHLTMERRSGQPFGIDEFLPESVRPHGSFAVPCPACPAVGFNMPEGWETCSPAKRHLYLNVLSLDGTHSLQKKLKNDDPDDVSLNEGRAYFVQDEPFRAFLERCGYVDKVRATSNFTCHSLRAVNMQNQSKFKNCKVTGVVVVVDSRHGLYMPAGMVDM
ncbi:hypothetical protein B0H21DRAFT_704547 [Amylocystis lapponica]|nr:hypothetical protein B0H21DRAFT_704547 [Amylocystis lapponica]